MRVTMLLPKPSHVRYHKRINALREEGIDTRVLSFMRDWYEGKKLPVEIESLGYVEHGHYVKRLISLFKALRRVRMALQGADIVYAFEADMALLGWLASRGMISPPKLVYEVGDIRGVLLENSVLSKVIRTTDAIVLNRSSLLVVTSPAYVTGYFGPIAGIKNLRYHVIENKLDPAYLLPRKVGREAETPTDGPIRVGYFGVLRCKQSWEILRRVAVEGAGRFHITVRGIPMKLPDFEQEARTTPNLVYEGPYVVPDDLPGMYGNVDVVWACYPYQGDKPANWKWARTCRFYESCYFQRPLFTQQGTEDARIVEERNIGTSFDLSRVDESVARILRLSADELVRWKQNALNLPDELSTYTDEHQRLAEILHQIVGKPKADAKKMPIPAEK